MMCALVGRVTAVRAAERLPFARQLYEHLCPLLAPELAARLLDGSTAAILQETCWECSSRTMPGSSRGLPAVGQHHRPRRTRTNNLAPASRAGTEDHGLVSWRPADNSIAASATPGRQVAAGNAAPGQRLPGDGGQVPGSPSARTHTELASRTARVTGRRTPPGPVRANGHRDRRRGAAPRSRRAP